MRTIIGNDIQAKPYWNEIKSMSDADKHALIHLIYSTMEEPEADDESLSEQDVEDFMKEIPAELMQKLAEHACQDSQAGRCTPLEDVFAEIKAQRGWK